jgi:hypothetical protein
VSRERSFRAGRVARCYRPSHRINRSTTVNPHRLLSLAVLASLATSAFAAGFSAPEQRLLEIQAARAPLALSGDGAWRLHVDAHDVLHRASLADPAQDTTLQLPPGVQLLAASNDGRRLALATRRQCVGLVDFGSQPGATPSLTWRPWIVDAQGVALGPDDGAWVAAMPADCGGGPHAAALAISSDGRFVATPEDVVDTATHRVVASLPTSPRTRVLRLQFVDHDARLLIAAATLPDAQGAGRLGFSVWDLASKALVNDLGLDAPLTARAALQVDFSERTGALFAVDERRRALAQPAATPARARAAGRHACAAGPRAVRAGHVRRRAARARAGGRRPRRGLRRRPVRPLDRIGATAGCHARRRRAGHGRALGAGRAGPGHGPAARARHVEVRAGRPGHDAGRRPPLRARGAARRARDRRDDRRLARGAR